MFDSIAPRYDALNHLLSLGADRRWRALTARAAGGSETLKFLDVATGTGDLAFAILDEWPSSRVVGVDPSANMLEIARRKAAQRGACKRIELCSGDAMALAFADQTFDGVGIAFGIRNVPDREQALAEMARVCRKGGRIVILELNEPRHGLVASMARFYVRHVMPAVGALLSRATAYRYLQTSMAEFPAAAQFSAMMEHAGIRVIEVRPLMFGVAVLFVGERR
jgi:demethylmenaquinone methyltransferase/2-methoxy-6-polyprenyl-1,4-benzoquinol methylase